MMLRKLAVGAAALLVGSFTVSTASPAYAQEGEADLAVSFVGTTISQGVDGKFGSLRLTNNGPGAASDVVFTYDTSALDITKVEFDLGCEPGSAPDEQVCPAIEMLLSGEILDLALPLTVVPGATSGSAGVITVTVSHAGTDSDTTNDVDDAEVVISDEGGVDLQVFAPNIGDEIILNEDTLEFEAIGDLLPGTETIAFVFVENQGSETASGIEISLTLPEHVTFTLPEPDCTHVIGDSTTTCQYEGAILTPSDMSGWCDSGDSCAFFFFPVKVSDAAPSPATLPGGIAEAWDMGLMTIFTAPAEEPETDPGMLPDEMLPDVDPSDNVSNFAFFVDELDDNGGGGGDVGDGGGDDEPLPVTGSPVVLISGFGAALLAVGAVLFLVARRRRLVPESSDD
jgi:hypothetical protein